MWYAAGNTSSYEMAARKGLGVLGFSVGSIDELEPVLAAYKKAIANAEPIGAFVNDNIMVTIGRLRRRGRARRRCDSCVDCRHDLPAVSNVFRYHDTFPHPDGVPVWPELIPDRDGRQMPGIVGTPGMIVGDPDHALRQCQALGGGGRRPAGLRASGMAPLGGHPRDDPPDRASTSSRRSTPTRCTAPPGSGRRRRGREVGKGPNNKGVRGKVGYNHPTRRDPSGHGDGRSALTRSSGGLTRSRPRGTAPIQWSRGQCVDRTPGSHRRCAPASNARARWRARWAAGR